jgi:hypothetical protein
LNADEDAALQELFEKATAKWGITSLNAA